MAKEKKTLEELLEEALVPVEEQPYVVPKNWVWIQMKSVTCILRGVSYKKSDVQIENNDDNCLILRGGNIQSGCIVDAKDNVYINKMLVKSEQLLRKNDVVIVASTGSKKVIGKAAHASENFDNISFGAFLNVIRGNNKINTRYISYYFQTQMYRNVIRQLSKGVNINNIKREYLEKLKFSLPPLKEQERIVNKIESLFSKLDRAKELIEEARENFENRKAAVLAKAFRGELTEKWREENIKENDIDFLLEKIRQKKINESKKNENFEFEEFTELFEIPTEWKWIKLKECTYKFQYGTSKKSSKEGKIPVLRMGNLQNGALDWNDLVYTSDETEIKKFSLNYDDILFNRTNSPELVGKTSIYKGEKLAIFAGYLIRVKAYEYVDADYINYFLNSTYAKAKCYEVKTDGVSQSNINSKKLGEFEIPLPPLEEQKEIVRILDNLLEQESKIKELTQLENQIELIKKSILAKAFRGELGTNDAAEESAVEVLKEVLKEKI